MEKAIKKQTYAGYAVTVPNFDSELIRIRPSKEAPEALAVFDSRANAEWFVSQFHLDHKCIIPVVIVRTDATPVVQ